MIISSQSRKQYHGMVKTWFIIMVLLIITYVKLRTSFNSSELVFCKVDF